jgi:hypothetical protein
MEPITVTHIKQNELTSECWLIQIDGINACKKCKYKDTKECGGSNIRKKLINKKGYEVPLNEVNQ